MASAPRPLPPGRLPLAFAHRGGALVRAERNTLDAFERAVRLGAGVESDVLLTADGVPVLLHPSPAVPRTLLVRRLERHRLPARIPSLAELYERCGGGFDLALDMADPRAAAAVVALAERHGAVDRLWLTYWRRDMVAAWRRRWPQVRIVFPALLLRPLRGPGPALDALAAAGVDAVNLFHRTLSPRLVEAAHARGLLVFAWGARHHPAVARAVRQGADGVFGDDVEGLLRATREDASR